MPSGFTSPGAVTSGRGGLTGSKPEAGESQSFLASELLPFIPKAIAAQSGIPMSKEIRVPLPADGSLDVPLSTLYHLCPELFASEITPLNDSVVTLPPRLGATPAAGVTKETPTSRPSLLGESSSNPFWSPVTSAAPVEPANPFAAEGQTGATPKASIAPRPNPGNDQPLGGFEPPKLPAAEGGIFGAGFTPGGAKAGASGPAPASGGFSSNPFESTEGFATLFSKGAEADADIPFPESKSGKEVSGDSEGVWGAMFAASGATSEDDIEESEEVTTSFESIGNLLKQSATSEPFAAPDPAPAPLSFGFPAAAFAPPALTPAPEPAPASFVPAAESPTESVLSGFGAFAPSAEAFGSAFAPFAKAPEPAPTPELAPIPEMKNPWAEFSPPALEPKAISVPAFEAPEVEEAPADQAPAMEPEPVAEPAGFAEPTGFVEPTSFVEAAPMSEPFVEPEAAPVPAGFAPAPAPAQIEAPAPVAVPEPAPAPPVAQEPAPTPVVPAAPVEAAPAVVPAPLAAPAPKPQPAKSAPVAAKAAVVQPAAKEEPDDMRDLELRAIFSTSESFTLSKVARKIVGIPGIDACSLSTPGKLVQASRREEHRIGNEAREMVSTLRNLAKLTGLPEARTFTLQTDRGVVSLFIEGECCVLVNHESSAFAPGVREKLILIARCISRLRD